MVANIDEYIEDVCICTHMAKNMFGEECLEKISIHQIGVFLRFLFGICEEISNEIYRFFFYDTN